MWKTSYRQNNLNYTITARNHNLKIRSFFYYCWANSWGCLNTDKSHWNRSLSPQRCRTSTPWYKQFLQGCSAFLGLWFIQLLQSKVKRLFFGFMFSFSHTDFQKSKKPSVWTLQMYLSHFYIKYHSIYKPLKHSLANSFAHLNYCKILECFTCADDA